METEQEIEAVELIYPLLATRLDVDGLKGFGIKVCANMEEDGSKFVELIVVYPTLYPAENPVVSIGTHAGIAKFVIEDLQKYIKSRVNEETRWDPSFPFEFIEYTMGFLEGNLQQSPAGFFDDDIDGERIGMFGDKGEGNHGQGDDTSKGHYADIAIENTTSALPGDPVTKESYEKWWGQFVESGAADWILKTKCEVTSDKLTGKQLWLRGELKIEE